jgi:hypothetical protein
MVNPIIYYFLILDLKLLAEHTGLFIFILSEGIFDSFWCLEELRSAILHKRRVLVLLDWQFKMPKEFPPELQDIASFLSTADTVLYMAEFFSECMKQIRLRLGEPDQQVAEVVDFLIPVSKQCVIDNSFGEFGKTLKFCKPLEMPVKDLFPYLERYYECSSIINVDSFEEAERLPVVPMTDEDVVGLAQALPRLKFMDIYVLSDLFTDQALLTLNTLLPNLQVLRLWKNCTTLTDQAMMHLAKMKQLKVLHLNGFVQLTDAGLIAISNMGLEELTVSRDEDVTDVGIAALPSSIMSLSLHSIRITSVGVQQLSKKAPKLAVLKLESAQVNDDAVIALMQNCTFIERVRFPSSVLTERCVNTVAIPGSFKDLTVAHGCEFPIPKSNLVLYWP